MKWKECKAIIKADYSRLLHIRGGYFQRLLLSPTFNLIFWFRICTWLETKRGLWKMLFLPILLIYKRKCAKYGVDLRVGTNVGGGLAFPHFGSIVINVFSKIGDNCMIFQDVTIGAVRKDNRMFVPIIGDNVVIFAGAKIIGDVKIGNYVVIGANAVVTKDVPEGAVMAGVPAKVISMKGHEISKQYVTGI